MEDIDAQDVLMKKDVKNGYQRKKLLSLALDSLPESQAGTVRHKSPHAAYAAGYLAGVEVSYRVTKGTPVKHEKRKRLRPISPHPRVKKDPRQAEAHRGSPDPLYPINTAFPKTNLTLHPQMATKSTYRLYLPPATKVNLNPQP